VKQKPARPSEDPRDRLLERFHSSLDHGDVRRAGKLLSEIDKGEPDAEAAFARWRLLAAAEDLAPALAFAQQAVGRFAESPELQHALGWTLLESGAAEEAIPHLEEACYLDDGFADAWHDLALARESIGDLSGMRQAFAEVYGLDTADPGGPLRWTPEQVLRWADRALESLPASVRKALGNLPIFVQDYPDDWILEEPPWDPRLLGLFDGPTYADMRADRAGEAPHVYLFQRNLERICPGPREMAEQVRITLHHEVGHFLGLDEDELHERGLG
jgi:predicted Zn-dependent protease with MMP-like domain